MLRQMISNQNLIQLCCSQYGNYVIQSILSLEFEDFYCDIRRTLIRNVFANIVILSTNKAASNVVEECMALSAQVYEEGIGYLLDIMLGNGCLIRLVHHRYANYCVQSLLTLTKGKQQKRLIVEIESIANLRSTTYAQHIVEKIKKIKGNKMRGRKGKYM